jgi:hypothetical protein
MASLVIEPALTFNIIPAGRWADANNPQNAKMREMYQRLNTLQGLWNLVAGAPAGDEAATTAAFNNLKNGPKIVDLNSGVFLGGKSRHKNKKNNKSRRRNQSKKQRK